MSKQFYIVFLFVSCVHKAQEKPRPMYDETALQQFFLQSRTMEEFEVSHVVDSIVNSSTADSVVYRKTIGFLIATVSNPNSRFCNEKLYSRLLQSQLLLPWTVDEEKKGIARKLKLLRQNNIGCLANDFKFITPFDSCLQMHDIQAKYILLYFNNPECPACKELKTDLKSSKPINKAIKNGKLKILSIYPDPDEKIWLSHLKDYPPHWIQGRDENEYLYKNGVYNLLAIPSMYLLDENKKVLLKDCFSVEPVEQILMSE